MKYTFRHVMEWSDRSEHSPSHTGQLPEAVILPDGERIDLGENVEIAHWNDGKSGAGYVQIHENVRVREKSRCDNPNARYGKSGAMLEVLAPKGSKFVFEQYCSFCGYPGGEQIVEYDAKFQYRFRAEDQDCAECVAIDAEQRHSIDETQQDEAEYFIR